MSASMVVERGRSVALATQAQFVVNHREEEEDDNRVRSVLDLTRLVG